MDVSVTYNGLMLAALVTCTATTVATDPASLLLNALVHTVVPGLLLVVSLLYQILFLFAVSSPDVYQDVNLTSSVSNQTTTHLDIIAGGRTHVSRLATLSFSY